jgi:hypothetical protein
MFKNLQHVQPSQLIGLIRSINWTSVDYDTRLVVLHELNNTITTFREKHGLRTDGLSGEPDTPFRTIKAILFPSNEGAHRSAARFKQQSSAA